MGIQSLILGHVISRDHDPERASARDDTRVANLDDDDGIDVGDDDGVDDDDDDDDDLKDDNRIDGEDLPGDRDNNDIIHEVDLANDPGPPVRRPRGYHFRRHLSLSGISTLSSIGPVINRRRSPPAWFTKLKSFFQPNAKSSSYIPNYRLTPIISGIVIPFSILLEIPGLTERWYIRTTNNQTVESMPKSPILVIGQAFSIACAIIANACLVIRFMEKRVKTMTLLCIALLTVHDIINIITITVFGVEHRINDNFTYGQSFWFTVCSTIASVFTNITLVVDFVRTPNFSRSGSGLTRKQRSLVIVVIILLCYIAFGALINSILIQLSFVDALYFSVVTIETIGFGDIVPQSTSSRIFDCLYATIGILNVALMISLMRETVLETLEVSYRIRMRKLRQWRRVMSTRRQVEERWRVAIEWRLRENSARTWVKDAQTGTGISHLLANVFNRVNWLWAKNGRHEYGRRYIGYRIRNHPLGMHLNLEALTPAQLEAAALEAGVPLGTLLPPNFKSSAKAPDSPFGMVSGGGEANRSIPLTHARLGRMMTMLSRFALALHSSEVAQPRSSSKRRESTEAADEKGDETADVLDTPQSDNTVVPAHIPITRKTSRRSHWHEYEAFRSKAEREERKAFYIRLSVAWILFIVFWTIGSAIFMVTEGWSYGIAMYFCFIAFTTIGFGDYHPVTPAGRSIFVVWALLGVGTMTILISVLSEAYSYRYKNAMHTHVFEKAAKRYRQTRIDKSRTSTPKADPLELHSDTHTALSESETRAQQQLEALPNEILQTLGSFNEHMAYFFQAHGSQGVTGRSAAAWVETRGGHGSVATMPEGMRELLDDIARDEEISGKIKEEIMQDEDARRTLFRLSMEKTLRQMIDAAEQVLDSVKQRNGLAVLHEQQSRDGRRKGRHRESQSGSDSDESPTVNFDGSSPASPSS